MKLAIDGGRPVRKSFLIFGSPDIHNDEIQEVMDVLKSGWLSTGPRVGQFEDMFKKYIGTKFALAVNSCTAGLHLSLLVSGIKPNDEVITCPMTFAATANVIQHVNAKPIFVDCVKSTGIIDVEKIRQKITRKTRAIIPVHFAGYPADMEAINSIARRYNLIVIEDAAHAIESQHKGRKVGTMGDLACFSFYVTKNATTGEGGMITTNSAEYAKKIQQYALHGLSRGAWMRYSDKGFKQYQVIFPGYKYNMMDLQAAIGLHQLSRIGNNLARRQQIWNYYNDNLMDLPITVPELPSDGKSIHARHLYAILLDLSRLKVDREAIQKALYFENIGTGIHYVSLHLHPYYKKTYGFRAADFPAAKFISDRTLSLPLSSKLTDDDVKDVVRALRKVILSFIKRR